VNEIRFSPPTSLHHQSADIPVFQLSIDFTKPPQYHYELETGHTITAEMVGLINKWL
jgi:aromatic ring-opening dioxygenase catalytic subunit (LigB family)